MRQLAAVDHMYSESRGSLRLSSSHLEKALNVNELYIAVYLMNFYSGGAQRS